MGIPFDKEAAMGADKGGYLKDCGVYPVTILNAYVTKGDKGAAHVEFSFESDTGEKAIYCKICTRKNDGSRAYGYNMVCALMGLLGLSEVSIETIPGEGMDEPKNRLKEFVGKKIQVGLQYEEYRKNNGDIGWKMVPVHFFDYRTKQTYAEKSLNESASVCLREIKPKLEAGASGSRPEQGQSSTQPEDDLPF